MSEFIRINLLKTESRQQNFRRLIYKKSSNSLFTTHSAIPQWFAAP